MMSEETKQRNRVLRSANKELSLVTKKIEILSMLVPDKIYKITLKIYMYGDSVVIGTPESYSKKGVVIKVLAAEHGLYRSKSEMQVDYEEVLCWEEWNNLEAPMIVNYKFISPKMKQQCFNLK